MDLLRLSFPLRPLPMVTLPDDQQGLCRNCRLEGSRFLSWRFVAGGGSADRRRDGNSNTALRRTRHNLDAGGTGRRPRRTYSRLRAILRREEECLCRRGCATSARLWSKDAAARPPVRSARPRRTHSRRSETWPMARCRRAAAHRFAVGGAQAATGHPGGECLAYLPSTPVLRSSLGGCGPSQQAKTASANCLPWISPTSLPRISSFNPVPGT